MALRFSDTRQRAYFRIDTCSAGGSWVDEPSYNKGRKSHGVLMGNWQEEDDLNDSIRKLPPGGNGTGPTSKKVADEAHGGKKMVHTPNYETSPFLTKGGVVDVAPQETFQTVYRGNFAQNAAAKRGVGKRKKLLEEQILREAEEALRETGQQGFPAAGSHKGPHGGYGVNTSRVVPNFENGGTRHWETTNNRVNLSAPKIYARPHDPVEPELSYLTEQPVSLFTMGEKCYTGQTAKTGDNPFKRNSNFTQPMGEFNKTAAHDY
eukprot:TRINITY_DN46979_c0_g1_i1.p1 TRINITY_DN46979_c0_g1~~TRINITY_DN46979_c0_g1_i1.p1  ORF type:complete len:263 (-),score=33.25 TRINITY_DN46979_c0_g1_i1:535-1323(-)